MRSPLVALVTIAAFLLLVLPPRLAVAGGADETTAAKQHFEAGRTAYLGGDYAHAITEFQAAQRLRPSPILDYNIGLCYEALGDAGNAYASFQRYLTAKPDAENRADVEKRMSALGQQLHQPPPLPETGAPPPPPPQQQVQQGAGADPYGQPAYPASAPPAPKKKKSYWWIVFPIVGGLALTGIIIWAATSRGKCGPPDCDGNYLGQPLSLEPGAPRDPGASLVLPGEVLRF